MTRSEMFEVWMEVVDKVLTARCGLDSRDLADCPYRDWFEAGMTAKGAARRAWKANL